MTLNRLVFPACLLLALAGASRPKEEYSALDGLLKASGKSSLSEVAVRPAAGGVVLASSQGARRPARGARRAASCRPRASRGAKAGAFLASSRGALGGKVRLAAAEADDGVVCEFSLQLESDPAVRQQYIDDVSAYNWASSPLRDRSVDSMSRDCLACHDGSGASSTNLNTERGITFFADHPVGMNYRYVSSGNPEFNDRSGLPSSMVFIYSKVGCLSCHDPLNDVAGKHLATDNQESSLCSACHNK